MSRNHELGINKTVRYTIGNWGTKIASDLNMFHQHVVGKLESALLPIHELAETRSISINS